jgi:hypothetical protein
MNGFLWSSGHLGWGVFSLLVFTVLWWLFADLAWRLKKVRLGWFVGVMAAAWAIVASLIVAGFWLANQL